MTTWKNAMGGFCVLPTPAVLGQGHECWGAVVIWYHSSYALKKELVQNPSAVSVSIL